MQACNAKNDDLDLDKIYFIAQLHTEIFDNLINL